MDVDASTAPRFFQAQLASVYTVQELRQIQHDAEIEAHVSNEVGDPDAGFWQAIVELCQASIPYRFYHDCSRSMALSKGRFTKRKAKIDYTDIKDRIDLVEYVGRYTTLKREGRHYVGCCPFHNDKTPSFVVWPAIKGFKCMGCGAKGDIITFAKLIGEAVSI